MNFNFFKRFQEKQKAKEREVCHLIGSYYLRSTKQDFSITIAKDRVDRLYKDVKEAIYGLGISKVKVEGNKITIVLMRPGLLIGRRGENINALQNYLISKLKIDIKIHIEEAEDISYRIIPQNPNDFDDWDDWDDWDSN